MFWKLAAKAENLPSSAIHIVYVTTYLKHPDLLEAARWSSGPTRTTERNVQIPCCLNIKQSVQERLFKLVIHHALNAFCRTELALAIKFEEALWWIAYTPTYTARRTNPIYWKEAHIYHGKRCLNKMEEGRNRLLEKWVLVAQTSACLNRSESITKPTKGLHNYIEQVTHALIFYAGGMGRWNPEKAAWSYALLLTWSRALQASKKKARCSCRSSSRPSQTWKRCLWLTMGTPALITMLMVSFKGFDSGNWLPLFLPIAALPEGTVL